MLEGKPLRRADFITGIILILFSLWMLIETFQMPMRDTYGGVENVWYVSPALLPLIIGIGLLILGVILLIHSIKLGGAHYFFETCKQYTNLLSESNYRFIAILIMLITFVYLFLPRFDFFLSILLFLFVFISVFYFEDRQIFNRLVLGYIAGCIFFILVYSTGLHPILINYYVYTMDLILFVYFLFLAAYTKLLIQRKSEYQRSYIITLSVSFLVPLILCPIFKYALLVPLPVEGIVIEFMNQIRYSL